MGETWRQFMSSPARLKAAVVAISGLIPASGAVAVECPAGQGVYQNVLDKRHTITFDGQHAGAVTFDSGRSKLKYRFEMWGSNGFSRLHMGIGSTAKEAHGKKAITTSVVLQLAADFAPYRGEGEAPFMVIPDLAVGLYYSNGFREREDYVELLPGDAWKLVGCR
jgi:hypothetical protein